LIITIVHLFFLGSGLVVSRSLVAPAFDEPEPIRRTGSLGIDSLDNDGSFDPVNLGNRMVMSSCVRCASHGNARTSSR
jgi:hypothetical protein